jgi:uncharacterized membrane protein YkoI
VKKKTAWIVAGATTVIVLGGGGVAYASTDGFDETFGSDNDRLTGASLERASDAALAEVGEGTVTQAERSDDADHTYSVEVRLDDGREADVELDDDYTVVRIDGDDRQDDGGGDDRAIDGTTDDATDDSTLATVTAEERAQAERVVLERLGEGTITAVERSDDADHAFEVELTRADGNDVDVELDAAFTIVEIDGVRQ